MKNLSIQFLGQCGFIITTPEVKVVIDPVLSDLIDNGQSIRNYPPVMEPETLQADYILCTHNHIDHFAEETVIRALNSCPKTKVIIPAGCKSLLLEKGILVDRILLLKDLFTLSLTHFSITGISTAHPIHKLNKEGLDENLAYCLKFSDTTLIHLGDTYLTPRLEESLKKMGKISVFMPPINGMDEIKAAAGIIGNLSIDEAAGLCAKLKPEVAIPTHFDMVKGNTADPELFRKTLNSLDKNITVWVPSLLGKLDL